MKDEYKAIIKACKGHFGNDGYEDAKLIIREIIYGRGNTEILWSELEYFKEVLLNARTWTLEQWETLNGSIMRDIYTSKHYIFNPEQHQLHDNRKDLFRDYCNSLCAKIQGLQVWSQEEGTLIDLNISVDYEHKIRKMLDKYNQDGTI